jgi:predicted dehydrogenase
MTSAFATIPGEGPLRLVLVGAGPMGRSWIRNLQASADVELVGLVDLDLDAAQTALAEAGLDDIPMARSVTEILGTTAADAVVNVTVPIAHHPVTTEALYAGLPVLSEKPIAPTVAEGLSLAAAAEATGQLLMVSQSRRYYRRLAQFKDAVSRLGEVGTVTTEFFRGPHFGGFRDEMAHPLLIDMAIHAFDAFRYLLDDEPVSVLCEEFNSPWSWYRGDASVTASFVTARGARYVYTGSWSSVGLDTSWNGNWRASAAGGTATWNGEDAPEWESVAEIAPTDPGEVPEQIAGSLAEFVRAVRTGATPMGTAIDNVRSLAMVEAAIRSAETGSRVDIGAVIDEALRAAIDAELRPDVAERLAAPGFATALGSAVVS